MGLLKVAESEDEGREDEEATRQRIMAKIKTMGRMRLMVQNLRESQEELVKLKGLCGGHLPRGVLLGGKTAIQEAIDTYEKAYRVDLPSERRPDVAVVSSTYPYDVLKSSPPEECDLMKLEEYLTDDEFRKVFNMPREEFFLLQTWKQLEAKRKVGLCPAEAFQVPSSQNNNNATHNKYPKYPLKVLKADPPNECDRTRLEVITDSW